MLITLYFCEFLNITVIANLIGMLARLVVKLPCT